MPDWSYGPLFKPLLFMLPAERARDLTLGAIGRLGRTPGGPAVIAALGHMNAPASLRRTVVGLDCPTPIGLGGGLDLSGVAARALARFELGFLELGPVSREPIAATVPIARRVDEWAIVYPALPANPGLDTLLRYLRESGRIALPVGVRLAHRPGATPDEATAERLLLIAALAPFVAFFTLDCGAITAGLWSRDEWIAHLAALGKVVQAVPKPLFLCLPPDIDADELIAPALPCGIAGVVVTGGVALDAERRIIGAPAREQSRRAVAHLRERFGRAIAIIAGDSASDPGDALALLHAGADLVGLHSGLVYAGPGLPKRTNEALLRAAPLQSPPAKSVRDLVGQLGFVLLGAGMVIGGILAWLVAAKRVVLPYDEAFVGLSREQLVAANAQLLSFMAHDRVTLAGTMLSIGILYVGLMRGAIRQRQGWAWSAIAASAAVGFPNFFLFLGFGYFDPLHALVSILLLPLFLVGLFWGHPRSPVDYGTPGLGLRNDRAWQLGTFGQLCFVLLGVGLAVGGVAIAVTGITQVFVPSDLVYLADARLSLQAISPQLVPLVAHDRAGFGGALFSNAIAVLLAALWGFRPGSRWLWWTLLCAGLPGFGATIGIHYIVGYTDPLHIAPVWLAALLYVLGLAFTWRFTGQRRAQPAERVASHAEKARPIVG